MTMDHLQSDLNAELEEGWRLEGADGRDEPLSLLISATPLARSYLGVTLGRHPKLCDLVIDDPTVSRRHFRVGRSGDGLFVEDLNSLNGTFLDNAKLRPFEAVALQEGHRLTAGSVVLTVRQIGSESPARRG